MAVPRNRSSNQKKHSRRAHHAKTALNFKNCSNCSALTLSHQVCTSCGFYNNRPVVQTQEEV